jgi:hypothetical protein
VRDHQHGLVLVPHNDLVDYRQGAGEHVQTRLTAFWREGERVGLPRRVFLRKRLLDFGSPHAFPAAMVDFAQAVDRPWLQAVRANGDARRLQRTLHRARIDHRQGLRGEPRGQATRLRPPFVREVHVRRAGEAVLCRKRRRTVAHEQDAGGHEGLPALVFFISTNVDHLSRQPLGETCAFVPIGSLATRCGLIPTPLGLPPVTGRIA